MHGEIYVYENTQVNSVRVENNANRTNAGEDKTCSSDVTLTRIKFLMCTVAVMMILLYAVIIVLITVFVIYAPDKQVDGKLAGWSELSSCDVTCGNGSQSRFRVCTNPTPTANGVFCAGNVTEILNCQLPKCQSQTRYTKRYNVTFSARLTKQISMYPSFDDREDEIVVFNQIINNNLNGYNDSSGIFIAPVSGVYLFIYFIEIDGEFGEVELRLNDKSIASTSISSMYIHIVITGSYNYATFHYTRENKTNKPVADYIKCLRGRYFVSVGTNNTVVGFQQFKDSCLFKGGVKARGGDAIITHVDAGSQVWIQNAGRHPIFIHPFTEGTFTGILLNAD